jgi:hypothetical protein
MKTNNFTLSSLQFTGKKLKLRMLFVIIFYFFIYNTAYSAFIDHVSPLQNELNISKTSEITVVFSQDMNLSTIINSNIRVFGFESGLLSTSISYDAGSRTANIDPANDFKPGEHISVTLTSSIQTFNGTEITPFIFNFTIASTGGSGIFSEVYHPIVDSGYGNAKLIISGDYDRDGFPDLCVANGSQIITILKNNGSGNFVEILDIFSIDLNLWSIITFDIDNDNDLDLAFCNSGDGFAIYKNNGNGIFNLDSVYLGSGGDKMNFGDVNSDGNMDLVVYNYPGKMSILLNDGNGTFLPDTEYYFGCCSAGDIIEAGFQIIDIDNDGDLDVAVEGYTLLPCFCNFTALFKNDGSGNFTRTEITPVNGSFFFSSGDLNNDRYIDLVENQGVIYLNNNGSGTFSVTTYPAYWGNINLADFDGDGNIDIAEKTASLLKLFKNDGTAVFTFHSALSTSYADYPFDYAFASGDFDADGDIDLAASNIDPYKISIFLNNSCVPALCSISGPENITIGFTDVLYTSSVDGGFWEISNYENTQALIVSGQNSDSVRVNSGSTVGHFVLYYNGPDGCGNTILLGSKHVFVDNPLPVELTNFESVVTRSDITLNWSTSSEVNNFGFEVMRSEKNQSWMSVGFVKGAGISAEPKSYSFKDMNLNSGVYLYRLKQIDFNGNFKFFDLSNEVVIGVPGKFFLSQNYPNPFNPVTKIAYDILISGKVRLKIYDNTGRELITLVEEFKEAGYYTVEFNGSRYASGIYYYKLESGNFISTKKMVLVK